MRKKYIKPEFGVDVFAVAQSIAENCGWNPNAELGYPAHADKTTCGWSLDNVVVFLDTMTVCTDPGQGREGWGVGEDEPVAGYCYNNPNGGTQIFAS